MESKIPLHRTGLIIFSARILSIFSGLLFLIMVTGWLSPPRFGLWEVILSFVAFASYPAGWLGFWATRDVARGGAVGKTTILLNLALSIGGVLAYLAYSLLSYQRFDATFGPFLLAVLLIPIAYWNQASNSIAAGYRPAALGYAILFSEVTKLLVAYPALFIFKLEIDGVILALIASNLVQAVFTTALVSRASTDSFSLELGRRWLSESWVPALYSLGAVVATADTVAAAAATGSTLLTGYYQAAFQVGTLVSYASFLSFALYPLLLRGESDEAPNAILDLILMFATPMAVGVIVLSPQLLRVLSPKYVAAGFDVSVALGLLAIVGLVAALSSMFDSTLIGREKADLDPQRGFRKYLGSTFSFVSIVNIASSGAYIVSVLLTTGLGTSAGYNVSSIVALWALSELALLVAGALVKLRRLRRVVSLRFPAGFPRYLLLSLVMAAVLYLLAGAFLQGTFDRLVFGGRVLGVALVGAAAYFGLLIAVDQKSRRLASEILHSFR